jgi:hypothetical protein
MSESKTLIISRRRWFRGGESDTTDSALRIGTAAIKSDVGKMCCLGFYCLLLGVSKEEIRDVGMPEQITPSDAEPRIKLPAWLLRKGERADVNRAAKVNDDPRITDEVRENKLTKIFRRRGVKAVFK